MPKHYNGKVGVNHIEAKNILRCELCGFTSQSSTAIKLHMKFSHKEITSNARTYTCGECDKKFDTYKKLETHFKSHKTKVNSSKFSVKKLA